MKNMLLWTGFLLFISCSSSRVPHEYHLSHSGLRGPVRSVTEVLCYTDHDADSASLSFSCRYDYDREGVLYGFVVCLDGRADSSLYHHRGDETIVSSSVTGDTLIRNLYDRRGNRVVNTMTTSSGDQQFTTEVSHRYRKGRLVRTSFLISDNGSMKTDLRIKYRGGDAYRYDSRNEFIHLISRYAYPQRDHRGNWTVRRETSTTEGEAGISRMLRKRTIEYYD